MAVSRGDRPTLSSRLLTHPHTSSHSQNSLQISDFERTISSAKFLTLAAFSPNGRRLVFRCEGTAQGVDTADSQESPWLSLRNPRAALMVSDRHGHARGPIVCRADSFSCTASQWSKPACCTLEWVNDQPAAVSPRDRARFLFNVGSLHDRRPERHGRLGQILPVRFAILCRILATRTRILHGRVGRTTMMQRCRMEIAQDFMYPVSSVRDQWRDIHGEFRICLGSVSTNLRRVLHLCYASTDTVREDATRTTL